MSAGPRRAPNDDDGAAVADELQARRPALRTDWLEVMGHRAPALHHLLMSCPSVVLALRPVSRAWRRRVDELRLETLLDAAFHPEPFHPLPVVEVARPNGSPSSVVEDWVRSEMAKNWGGWSQGCFALQQLIRTRIRRSQLLLDPPPASVEDVEQESRGRGPSGSNGGGGGGGGHGADGGSDEGDARDNSDHNSSGNAVNADYAWPGGDAAVEEALPLCRSIMAVAVRLLRMEKMAKPRRWYNYYPFDGANQLHLCVRACMRAHSCTRVGGCVSVWRHRQVQQQARNRSNAGHSDHDRSWPCNTL
jgi:hypothetical protein